MMMTMYETNEIIKDVSQSQSALQLKCLILLLRSVVNYVCFEWTNTSNQIEYACPSHWTDFLDSPTLSCVLHMPFYLSYQDRWQSPGTENKLTVFYA